MARPDNSNRKDIMVLVSWLCASSGPDAAVTVCSEDKDYRVAMGESLISISLQDTGHEKSSGHIISSSIWLCQRMVREEIMANKKKEKKRAAIREDEVWNAGNFAEKFALAAEGSEIQLTPKEVRNKRRRLQGTKEAVAVEGETQVESAAQSKKDRTEAATESKQMSTTRAIPLLICSVGNPAPYLNTLHSAGHTVLNQLAAQLGYSTFAKDRALGNGLVSKSPHQTDRDWTLWQSTSLMNVSGSGVRAAFNTWSKSLPDGGGKLVVVHDELEKPLGAVSLNVRQGASAKGHNGLKSIMSSLGGKEFVRIGVGIGRPVSRESKDVAAYVLMKTTAQQRKTIEGSVEAVIAKLMELERG